MNGDLDSKRASALGALAKLDSLIVAVSGGVDSAVLLALATEALGARRVVAATGLSASLPGADLDDARRVADHVGVRHELVPTHELENEAYRANRGDRCFHCRTELFRVLRGLSDRFPGSSLAYGAIKDDLADDRPGMEAARQHGVLAPLLEAGMTKEDVRALARERQLPVAERPAAACLASRIPVGTEVTDDRLRRVELAEAALRRLGFRRFRVRYHGDLARLELDADGARRIASPSSRARVLEAVRAAGFRWVTEDLAGYRGELALLEGARALTGPKRSGGQ